VGNRGLLLLGVERSIDGCLGEPHAAHHFTHGRTVSQTALPSQSSPLEIISPDDVDREISKRFRDGQRSDAIVVVKQGFAEETIPRRD
jgi:hypothetical protein